MFRQKCSVSLEAKIQMGANAVAWRHTWFLDGVKIHEASCNLADNYLHPFTLLDPLPNECHV